MSDAVGTVVVFFVAGAMVWGALALSRQARVSYKRAALITAGVFAVGLTPLMYLGAGLVGPTDLATMAPGFALFGTLFAVWCGLWCWFVVRKRAAHG